MSRRKRKTILVYNDEGQYNVVRADSAISRMFIAQLAELLYWKRIEANHRIVKNAVAERWYGKAPDDPVGVTVRDTIAACYERLFAYGLLVEEPELRKKAAKIAAERYFGVITHTHSIYGHDIWLQKDNAEIETELDDINELSWTSDLTKAEVRGILQRMGIDVPNAPQA